METWFFEKRERKFDRFPYYMIISFIERVRRIESIKEGDMYGRE